MSENAGKCEFFSKDNVELELCPINVISDQVINLIKWEDVERYLKKKRKFVCWAAKWFEQKRLSNHES